MCCALQVVLPHDAAQPLYRVRDPTELSLEAVEIGTMDWCPACQVCQTSHHFNEFCNCLIGRLEQLTGFKHNIKSAYPPQSNGLDEHFNQTLKVQLQKMVNEHQDNYNDLLDNTLFAYRTSCIPDDVWS